MSFIKLHRKKLSFPGQNMEKMWINVLRKKNPCVIQIKCQKLGHKMFDWFLNCISQTMKWDINTDLKLLLRDHNLNKDPDGSMS